MRASLSELARALAEADRNVDTHVFFIRPRSVPAGWERTDLWRWLEGMPGVQLHSDEAQTEARRFGVRTSGHVLLYDRAGDLVFSGGITAGRGHEGDNAGRSGLIGRLRGGTVGRMDTPVFGCPLFSDHDPAAPCCEEAGPG
jgi:hypothetical protein